MGRYALRFGYGCHGNRKVTLQAGCNTLVYRLHCQTLRNGCYKYHPSGYKRTSSFICTVPAPWIISIPTRRKCVAHLMWGTCVLLPLRPFSKRERKGIYFWIRFKSCGGWSGGSWRLEGYGSTVPATQLRIPQDLNLQQRRCKNLITHIF